MSENIIFQEFLVDENEEPIENEDGRQLLCKVIFEGKLDTMYLGKEELANSGILNVPEQSLDTSNNSTAMDMNCYEKQFEWTDGMTKIILDKYHEYLANVGPMKKFKLKKHMWEQISQDLKNILGVDRTAQQVENRFKTIMKRKKGAMGHNKKTGETRELVEYEEELKKIAAVDDSIEPEVLKGQEEVIVNNKVLLNSKTGKEKNRNNVYKLLKSMNEERQKQIEKLHKEREEQKERRHKEKIDILREFLNQTKLTRIE